MSGTSITNEEFLAHIEVKKARAVKFGGEFKPTEEEAKRLRRIKFGEPEPVGPPATKKRAGGESSKDKKKQKKSAVAKDKSTPKPKTVIDIMDPIIRKRFERFGRPEETKQNAALVKAYDELQDLIAKEARLAKFSSTEEKVEATE